MALNEDDQSEHGMALQFHPLAHSLFLFLGQEWSENSLVVYIYIYIFFQESILLREIWGETVCDEWVTILIAEERPWWKTN